VETELVFHIALEQREAVVHVNVHAHAARLQQLENFACSLVLGPTVMAVADCVYAKNEIEGAGDLVSVATRRFGHPGSHFFRAGLVEFNFCCHFWAEIAFRLAPRGLDQHW
jgi:hypothetical protein